MNTLIGRNFKELLVESKGGCLVYPGSTRSLRIDGNLVSLARMIYEEYIGELPYRCRILRTCDNGKCLNFEHMMPSLPMDKFWRFVDIGKVNECWNWEGAKDGGGYGTFVSPVIEESKSHRISWAIVNGEIPDGFWVLHKCDNSSCINPYHLFLGTHRDNMWDKVKKERQSRMMGARNGRSLLTEKEVREIRDLYALGNFSYRKLAFRFGISQTQMARIIKRESWSWVD